MHNQYKVSVFERVLIASILLYAAMVLCLPVPPNDQVAEFYPWWAKRVDIGKILLHELLFIAWVVFYGSGYMLNAIIEKNIPTRQAAFWLAALALWCGIISLSAPIPGQDIGRTFRLLLNVALLMAVVRWSRQLNCFPALMLLLGFLIGTVINLLMSFQYPLLISGIMRLHGQNTPGVAMGLAIHLGAWVFYRANHMRTQIFVLLATVILTLTCAVSFSRIGWFTGGLGLLTWFYVIYLSRPTCPIQRNRLRSVRWLLTPILLSGILIAPTTQYVQTGVQWLAGLIEQKASNKGESNNQRLAYLYGTIEILSKHPFGVGYSGFYDAMTSTKTYRSPDAPVESSASEANPHATFLWYASAGGVPGLIMAVMVFIMLLNSMKVGLNTAMGRDGYVLFLFVAPTFLLMGLTVPYLLNSIVLIVPVAIAAGWGWLKRSYPLQHYMIKHPAGILNAQ